MNLSIIVIEVRNAPDGIRVTYTRQQLLPAFCGLAVAVHRTNECTVSIFSVRSDAAGLARTKGGPAAIRQRTERSEKRGN
jgi:hypothetical protein